MPSMAVRLSAGDRQDTVLLRKWDHLAAAVKGSPGCPLIDEKECRAWRNRATEFESCTPQTLAPDRFVEAFAGGRP